MQSSTIAVDGDTIYVANPDSDSISVISRSAKTAREVLLTGVRPSVDANGDYEPAVMPRMVAIGPGHVYATGERSGKLYELDGRSVDVCSEPIGVVAIGGAIYVACSQDAEIAIVDAATFVVTARVKTAAKPWAMTVPGDGSLYVSSLLGPGLTAIDLATRATRTLVIPDVAPRGDARLAHGQVRGLHGVTAHADELWVPHLLLGTDTAQPALDFESTVFPAVTRLALDGTVRATLSIDAQDVPGIDGAFADVVSGPRAIAFWGDRAYVVDAASEDLLVLDAATGVETELIRPLPGHGHEGLAIADGVVYVDARMSGDVVAYEIETATATTLPRLDLDPMPAELRLGQRLFFSANSDEFPVTQNHWVACASCHLEGRSDAVTWNFLQGPRDTPTNAGGLRGTGFLFRTAARTRVQDYWHTIDLEQGGAFDPIAQAPLLDALAAFVEHGLPLPSPPRTEAALVTEGAAIFARADVGCATCHAGPRFTDSGAGNPTLDLAGPVRLHDVGTCVTAPYPDAAQPDVAGHPRAACLFDTPSLSGVASTPPYLHDGRAPTLRDVLERTRGTMGDITGLSPHELDALVEYLRSL